MSQRKPERCDGKWAFGGSSAGLGEWGESSRREVPRQPPLEVSVGASPGSLGPEHWTLVLVLRGCWKLGLEMLVLMCLLPSSRAQQFAREGEDE